MLRDMAARWNVPSQGLPPSEDVFAAGLLRASPDHPRIFVGRTWRHVPVAVGGAIAIGMLAGMTEALGIEPRVTNGSIRRVAPRGASVALQPQRGYDIGEVDVDGVRPARACAV